MGNHIVPTRLKNVCLHPLLLTIRENSDIQASGLSVTVSTKRRSAGQK